MRKYLELFINGFDETITDKIKVENKPYIGYSLTEGKLAYTVVPKPVTGPADNEIWYTSSDGNVVTPNVVDVFGANIVSNTYENGKGVIEFDNSVTSIGENAFYGCSSLSSITIPNSVTSLVGRIFLACFSLTSVIFNGTMEEWNNITKSSDWYWHTSVTYVQCSDGQVVL